MTNTSTTSVTFTESGVRCGDVSALLFGEVMSAARRAFARGESERGRGLVEAASILSGVSVTVLLDRLA